MNPLLLITLVVIGAVTSLMIAGAKGRNVVGWTIFGALFPLISVIAICCLPARNHETNNG